MLTLAIFGFANVEIPLGDKLLRLTGFCIATTVFYFIFDVEEDARRIWVWRHSPLILTAVVCLLIGGVLSEIVQSILPYKDFEIGDIAANLIGSSAGLYIAYNLERYYRHRREIARLYRPVALDDELEPDLSEDEDEQQGTMLLPMYQSQSAQAASPNSAKTPNGRPKAGKIRLGDVWDEREELFGIGDSDEEDGPGAGTTNRKGSESSKVPGQSVGPKIIVTSS